MITMDEELFLDSYLGMIMELIEAQKEEAKKLKHINGLLDEGKDDIIIGEMNLFEKAVMLAFNQEVRNEPPYDHHADIRASLNRRKILRHIFQNSVDYRMKEEAYLAQIFIRNDLKIVHKREEGNVICDFSIFQQKE